MLGHSSPGLYILWRARLTLPSCLSKTGLMLARIFQFLVVCQYMYMLSPAIYGLKGHWPVSRRVPEPRRFYGDPGSLACDNIYIDSQSMTKLHLGQVF